MSSKKPFLSFIIEEDFLKDIDEYRFKNHFESRAAAIKYLLKCALKEQNNNQL